MKYIKEWFFGAIMVWFLPFINWNEIKINGEKISEKESKEIEWRIHKLFRRYIIIWACFTILLLIHNFSIIWAIIVPTNAVCIFHGFSHCFIVLNEEKAILQDRLLTFYHILASILLGYTMVEIYKKL